MLTTRRVATSVVVLALGVATISLVVRRGAEREQRADDFSKLLQGVVPLAPKNLGLVYDGIVTAADYVTNVDGVRNTPSAGAGWEAPLTGPQAAVKTVHVSEIFDSMSRKIEAIGWKRISKSCSDEIPKVSGRFRRVVDGTTYEGRLLIGTGIGGGERWLYGDSLAPPTVVVGFSVERLGDVQTIEDQRLDDGCTNFADEWPVGELGKPRKTIFAMPTTIK